LTDLRIPADPTTAAAMNAFEQLKDVIAHTLKVPPASIGPDTGADNLPAWDSLGHVNLMMSIEQTFDLQLDVDDFPRLNSVPAILAHLKARGVD
jgi:acyl carrier protein